VPRSLSKRLAQLERTGGRTKRDSFNKWRKYVDAIDFLENLGIANISQATADEIQFSCPFPDHTHGDESPSASMNDGSKDPMLNTAWTCYGCKRGGNAVTFLAEFENITRQEASKLLKAHYARGYIAPKYGSIAREFEARYKASKERHIEPTLFVLDWSIADRFEVDWGHYAENYRGEPDVDFMLDRGFSPAVLEEWGIGYDDDSQRITIPICDQYGNLVGFKGRAWRKNARPKYLVMGNKGERQRYDFNVYDKSLVVFGLDRWGHVDSYVLVEGELDVIALWCMGIPAICCGGSTMSVAQAKLIREYCDEVVMFFDNDAAGKIGVFGREDKHGEHKPGILELLEPHMRVRVVGRHRYDANDYLQRDEADRCRELIASATASYAL
jgi:DNA primase